MAKEIVIQYEGEQGNFSLRPIDRSMLYGKRKRQYVDESGNPCSRATLLDDGSLLIKAGMTGQAYFLPSGESLKLAELEAFNADGKPLEKQPSTLGVAQTAVEASPEDLLDLNVQAIYFLESQQLPDKLRSAIEAGKILRFEFNYREDFEVETAFLVANEQGHFALVGRPVNYEWVSFESAVDLPPDDVDTEDELDFEML